MWHKRALGATHPLAWQSASITDGGEAFLTVNSKVVAHTGRKQGKIKIAADGGSVDRVPGGAMRIGQHIDGTHGLRGYIADVGVWPEVLGEEDLQRIMCGRRRFVGVPPTMVAPFVNGKQAATLTYFDASEVVGQRVKAVPTGSRRRTRTVPFLAEPRRWERC